MADEKRKYPSETLSMPPLKMVLVHIENERQNAAAKTVSRSRKPQEQREKEAVLRIIEHLNKEP